MDYLQQRLERVGSLVARHAEQVGTLSTLPARLDAIEAEQKQRAAMKAERAQARKDRLALMPYIVTLLMVGLTAAKIIDPQLTKELLPFLQSASPK